MGERDTYQIILQLKDDLTAGLKQVNATLNQTKVAGQQTAEGVKTFTDKVRSAVQPIRDFSRVVSSIMAFGGIAMILNRIANAIGDMEKAYAKLHPESQKALGSLASWNETLLNLKADQGEIVATLLGPIREAFIKMIDPVGAATREMRMFNTELSKLVDKYKSEATKKLEEHAAMMATLTMAQERNRRAAANQLIILKDLAEAQKDVNDLMKHLGLPGATEGVMQAEKRVEILKGRLQENKIILDDSLKLMKEIPIIIKEQADKTKVTADTTVKLTEAEKLMNEYLKTNIGLQKMRLEVAQDYMDVMDQIYQIETERMKQSARAPKPTPIGRTTPSGLRFLDPYANAELAEAGDELKRINDEFARMHSQIPAVAGLIKTLAETLRDEFEQLFKDMIETTLISIFKGLGEAAAGVRDFASAMADLAQQLLDTIGTFLIQAGLKACLEGNWPLGLALLAAGGMTLIGAGGMGGGRQMQGIPNPLREVAAPDINPYRAPALAGNIGGVTIIAPNARYLDARTAGQLVKMGLAAMKA